MYNRLDRILACDGRTDGRTDRHLNCHGIVRAMHTRRAVIKPALFRANTLYNRLFTESPTVYPRKKSHYRHDHHRHYILFISTFCYKAQMLHYCFR